MKTLLSKSFKTLLFLFFFSLGVVYSQESRNADLLIRRDGSIMEVKIVEIKAEEVLYRKLGEPEGPVYVMLKPDLLSVRYANGETVNFTISVDSFYSAPTTAPTPSQGELYRAPTPKNDFQKSVLEMPTSRLDNDYALYRQGKKKGKALGFTGFAIKMAATVVGSAIIAANTDTDVFGNSYYTDPDAAAAGGWIVIGGTVAGLVMGPLGFVRSAKNGNKAKFIRSEMRRRGVTPTVIRR